jgi:hypothetical protein
MAQRKRLTTALILSASIGLAVLLTATSGNYAPEGTQVLGPTLALLGLVWLGRTSGWWSVPIVTASVVVVGYVGSALFYDGQADVPPELRASGMDEIGRDPGSVIILLPVVWLALRPPS